MQGYSFADAQTQLEQRLQDVFTRMKISDCRVLLVDDAKGPIFDILPRG